jgi:hypothetical protein
MRYSWVLARRLMLPGMTTCPYCHHPATMTIVATPDHVCVEHALEFWTGLLAYTRGRSAACVKNDEVCDCPLCEEHGAQQRRASAITSVGPSPGDHVEFAMPIAS